MVWTTIDQRSNKLEDGGIWNNDSYRVKNHFKELHVHNSPPRKNKDFKPVLYGDFIGMLNFKLSEPFAMLRHTNDLLEERHQLPIQWARAFIKGAFIGGTLYGIYDLFNDAHIFANEKLYLLNKKGPFQINSIRVAIKKASKP